MLKPDSEDIIRLLEAPVADRRHLTRELIKHASVPDLVDALEKSNDLLVQHILCYILGEKHDDGAIEVLIGRLTSSFPEVRSAAADALGKIGNPQTGQAIFECFNLEENVEVKQLLAISLGAVKYASGIPALIQTLEHPNDMLRGCAAWSLGALKAKKAKRPLELALSRETDPHAQKRMEIALKEIDGA